jgi:hypothetical protein
MTRLAIAATRAALAAALVVVVPTARGDEPIRDNSLLVEEAYNQERGVVQHIATTQLEDDGYTLAFTDEWPVAVQAHQLSLTVPLHGRDGAATRLGDLVINYRYQLLGVGGGAVAFAPRLSLVLPTGDAAGGAGRGAWGAQLNLPVSLELPGPLVAHANLGGALAATTPGARETFAGASLIVLVHPRLNLLVEATWTASHDDLGDEQAFAVCPALRGAIDVGAVQIVPALGVPLEVGGGAAVLFYLSVEHPFLSTRPHHGE